MKQVSFGVDVCDWCLEEVTAPHQETLEALWKAVHPGGWDGNAWMYQPAFAHPVRWAALTARQELNSALLDQARGPAVTIDLEFSGEEGSLTLCAWHVQELLTGIHAIPLPV